eukprot:1829860-Lingulodinium_polyedra.AAC.1
METRILSCTSGSAPELCIGRATARTEMWGVRPRSMSFLWSLRVWEGSQSAVKVLARASTEDLE